MPPKKSGWSRNVTIVPHTDDMQLVDMETVSERSPGRASLNMHSRSPQWKKLIFPKCFQSSGCTSHRQPGWSCMNILVAARPELIPPTKKIRGFAEDGFRSSDTDHPLISPGAPLRLAAISASKCVSGCADVSAGRPSISKPNSRTLGVFVMFARRRAAHAAVRHPERQVNVEPEEPESVAKTAGASLTCPCFISCC